MSQKLIRTLAFVALFGIVFVASCATFAQSGRSIPERAETVR